MSLTDNVRYIPLTQGKVAVVDSADYDWLIQWKWCAHRDQKNGKWYATRGEWRNGRVCGVQMHRFILNPPEALKVDHIDGDGLNNRRSNLRTADTQQNLCNRGRNRTNTSGFKGVAWHKRTGKWQAKIGINGKKVFLGVFADKETAARKYAEAAVVLHGEFSNTGD